MAGFKPRKIDFPDHTADDFDPSVIVTHNGVDYTWNGAYGWEVVCKGGSSVEEYDDQWIKDDQQRQDEDLQKLKEDFEKDQGRQDDHLEHLMDEVAGEINALREDICYYDFTFNYKLIQGADPDPGECAVPFEKPEECQMFRLHRTQIDGTVVDTTEVHVDDIIYFEQNLGDWIQYEILRVDDLGPDHFQIAVNYLSHGNNNLKTDPPKYYWDRPCLIYEKKADFDPCDKVSHPEFEKDQERQDEAFEKDQKRQDEALQAEINARADRDLLHDAQLSTLEYKLDQLVGLQFKGIYEFKHEADCNRDYELCIQNCMSVDPDDTDCRTMCGQTAMDCERDKVRPGYFEAVDPDDQFDHLQYIVISKADKAGVEIEWANVLKKDDYLEVDHTADGVLDKTNYGLYRIIEDPVESKNAYGEEVYTMRLEFLQGDGVMNVRENYEIRGITAAEGVNPEELGDFLTKDEANNLYALSTHAHAWGDITGKPSSFPPSSHTHNYASSNHTHSGYASSSHTHSGYASSSHGHGSAYVKNSNSSDITISKSSGVYYISGG